MICQKATKRFLGCFLLDKPLPMIETTMGAFTVDGLLDSCSRRYSGYSVVCWCSIFHQRMKLSAYFNFLLTQPQQLPFSNIWYVSEDCGLHKMNKQSNTHTRHIDMHRCHQNGTASLHPACVRFSWEFCSIHATCVLLVPLSVSLTLTHLFLRCSFLLYFWRILKCL